MNQYLQNRGPTEKVILGNKNDRGKKLRETATANSPKHLLATKAPCKIDSRQKPSTTSQLQRQTWALLPMNKLTKLLLNKV